ncbi:ABC transporter substrate-binding protein [Acidianus sulfidivorans JP7]|uniref:Cellobiose-binding protein n=2 Tax=Acidianus TaxID=12914 RepID=A0A2U9IQD4_9CREN|nr:ABC transporter substrate-binding protein [Acidianus sulfidivorans JP7]
MSKKYILKIVSTLVVLVSITMLISPSIITFSQSSSSSTLTIGWVTTEPYTSISTYNPNIFTGIGLGGAFYGLVYAYSAVLNVSNNQMIPGIVENWSFSPSNWVQIYNQISSVNVTLHLNPAYHWANGQPVTAYDILATCLVLDAYSAPPYPNYTVINNYTITISYPKSYVSPYLPPFTLLDTVGLGEVAVIINYNLWKPIVSQIEANFTNLQDGKIKPQVFRNEIHSFNPALYGPISESYNGPFYVAGITSSEIILDKNPYYPNANKIPWNQVIIYHYSSTDDLLAALKSGQIDLLYAGATSLPSSFFSALPSYYKIVSVPNPGGYALYFNFKNPWLSNVLVRQAIAYVLNRTAIALAGGVKYKAVTTPNGIPNFSYFKEFMTPAVSHLNTYQTNLAEATKLLEEAGFTKKGGVWYTPNGTPFTLHIVDTISNSPGVENMLTVIESELDSFGIQTSYSISLTPSVNHQLYATGTGYDLVLQSWGGYYPGTIDWGLPLSYLGGYPYNVTQWDLLAKLPNGSVYNLSKLYVESTSPNSTSQLISANDEIAYAMNYFMPILPLVEESYIVVYNSQVVSAPPSTSPFWEQTLYGIGGTAFLQTGFNYGYLSSPTVTTTVSHTTTTVSTTTKVSSSTILYAGIAVVVIIVIIAAVLLLRRRR